MCRAVRLLMAAISTRSTDRTSPVKSLPAMETPPTTPQRSAGAAAHLLADVLAGPPRLGSTRLTCLDGPAGSGKTTLAALLAATPAHAGSPRRWCTWTTCTTAGTGWRPESPTSGGGSSTRCASTNLAVTTGSTGLRSAMPSGTSWGAGRAAGARRRRCDGPAGRRTPHRFGCGSNFPSPNARRAGGRGTRALPTRSSMPGRRRKTPTSARTGPRKGQTCAAAFGRLSRSGGSAERWQVPNGDGRVEGR